MVHLVTDNSDITYCSLFVARGFDQEPTDLVLNLKRFKLKRMLKKTSGLSDDDVNKLRSISPQHPLMNCSVLNDAIVQQWA
jgi:hypothetical protein